MGLSRTGVKATHYACSPRRFCVMSSFDPGCDFRRVSQESLFKLGNALAGDFEQKDRGGSGDVEGIDFAS